MICSGWLIFPGLASNQYPSDLYFQEDRIAWCREPFPILKLSGDGTVHHLTSIIKTLPKKDQKKQPKVLGLLRTFSVLLTAKQNLGPRATQIYSEINSHFTQQAQTKGIWSFYTTGILNFHKLHCD
jgi:hypothetical protein